MGEEEVVNIFRIVVCFFVSFFYFDFILFGFVLGWVFLVVESVFDLVGFDFVYVLIIGYWSFGLVLTGLRICE